MPLPGRPGTDVLPMCSTWRSGPALLDDRDDPGGDLGTRADPTAATATGRRSYGPIGRR